MTQRRGVRGPWHAVLAAVGVALGCLRPAAAQVPDELAWDIYAPPAISVGAVDDLIATAGVRVPRDVLISAYERYLGAWRALSDGWGPVSADLSNIPTDQSIFGSVDRARAIAEAAGRSARDRERLEGALFADIAANVPEVHRAAVDRARVRRSLRMLLEESEVYSGDELLDRVLRCDLESAIDDALRDEPEALAAARAAVAPFADRRLAAAREAVEAERRKAVAAARAAEASGLAVSRSEWMQLRMDARPASEGETADDIALRERAQRRLDEVNAVFESMSRATVEVHRPASRDLCRTQWDACRAALLAVEPSCRWRLFRGIFRDPSAGAADAVVPESLVAPLRRKDAGPECEACVHRAVERWRSEGVEHVMRHLDCIASGIGLPDPSGPGGESPRMEKSRAELEQAAARIIGECGGACPPAPGPDESDDSDDGAAEPAVVCDRLERIPEFAAHARLMRKLLVAESGESDGGAEPDINPYQTWSAEFTDHFGMAASSAWLRESLASLGVPAERLDAVDGIAADHRDRWESARAHDADSMRAMLPEDAWVAPQLLPSVRQQDAEGRRGAAAADAALIDALAAAFGDVLSEPDRQLLSMARALGDARSETTAPPYGTGPFRSIRANPADAVLATALPPASRAAAAQALQARLPSLLSALASARGAARAFDACSSTLWSGWGDLQSWADRRARSVAMEDARREALQSERACRAAFDAAIDAACAAVPADDAAKVRAMTERRRYPDAFRPEAALRALWTALDAEIPSENQELRVSLARHVDHVLALMADARSTLIERSEALLRRMPIDAPWRESLDAATRAALGSMLVQQAALRGLSVERLRWAVPRDIRMGCRDWERYCRAIDARESDRDLDSAP